jgi:sec-independent protein translocase protein TatA
MALSNPIHIAFLLVVLLLVFGARRLPEMGRSLGSGMRGFRDAISGEDDGAAAAVPEQLASAPAQPLDPPAPAAHPVPTASQTAGPHMDEAA